MKRNCLLLVYLFAVLGAWAQPKIVAHRGYWDTPGSAQNSIAALEKAAEIGCYGSEFDVSITSDGVLVVNHDASIQGVVIEDNPYEVIQHMTLNNGEQLPTLAEYLECGLLHPNVQLILEIKPHKAAENEIRAADAVVQMVKNMGLQSRVEYISFSMRICERIHALQPEAKVAYLNGDLSPLAVKEKGLTGVDYHYSVYVKNDAWLDEAKKNGVEVNVWTVDDPKLLDRFTADSRIDLITTNKPVR
ncbi:MAG: glycerophosphodiester phosphodiesterase family protein [Bacteroidales bacterium]|nr:glycerophosphodiester phosphodiesterase family protein [Bacteroidales bacterium]